MLLLFAGVVGADFGATSAADVGAGFAGAGLEAAAGFGGASFDGAEVAALPALGAAAFAAEAVLPMACGTKLSC